MNNYLPSYRQITESIGYWKLPISLGLLTIGVYGVVLYGFGLLLYDITSSTKWTISSMSLANTLGSIGGAAFGVLAGMSLRWISARVLMCAGLLVGSIAIWAASLATSQTIFIICWTLGASTLHATLFYHITMALVAQRHAEDRAKAFMILTLVGGLSSPIFIPVGGLISSLEDWRFAMQVMSLGAVLFAIPGLMAAPTRAIGQVNTEIASDKSNRPGSLTRTMYLLVSNRQLIFLTLIFSLYGLATNGIQFHHVAAIQTLGFSLSTAVAISGARGFLSLPGRAALAFMENKLGAKRALTGVYLMTFISTLAFLLEPSLTTMWAFAIIGGIAFGTLLPLQGLLASESIGERNFEATLASQQGAVSFIASFGALGMGALYAFTSNYQTVFLLAAVVQLAGIIFLQFWSKPRTQS